MKITIARNLFGPAFALGYTNSRLVLKSERLRSRWKTINGFRIHFGRIVVFCELWKPSFRGNRIIDNLYKRRGSLL